jgi:prolyl 4-hydroxylase
MGLPIQLVDLDVPFAWEVPDLLREPECAALLAQTQGRPWAEGTVNGREGRVVRPELRDVDVCAWKDEALAALLQERLRAQLPARMRGDPLVGIRPNVRIYRYKPGQFFAPHRDQKYREADCVSHLGLLLYLDRVEEGGATWFHEVRLRTIPRPGLCVLFQNATLHEGEVVVRGQKHVLRADVMYRELNQI